VLVVRKLSRLPEEEEGEEEDAQDISLCAPVEYELRVKRLIHVELSLGNAQSGSDDDLCVRV
jgi:hypothetical protein